MKKKILIMGLIFIMMFTSVYAGNLNQDFEMDTTIKEVSLWDKFKMLFSGNDYSTINDMGTVVVRERGEYFDLKTRFRCQEYSDGQKFTIGWNPTGGSSLQTFGQVVTSDTICQTDKWYNLVIENVEIPEFTDNLCGSYFNVMLKHERLSYGSWKLDTDGANDISGFEQVAKVQIECEKNACDGKTGTTTGNKFCNDDDDVVILQYTNIVRNGECVTNNKVLQNCAYKCNKGACVSAPTKVYGYIFENNKCFNTYYMSDKTKPNNFYESLNICKENIIPDEEIGGEEEDLTQTVYIINEDTCDLVTFSSDNLPEIYFYNKFDCDLKIQNNLIDEMGINNNNTDIEDGTNDGNNGNTENTEKNWFEKFLDWLKNLFNI